MAYARTYDGPAFAADFAALFRHQLSACNLQQGELCIAITDTAWMPAYGAACIGAANGLGADTMQATFGWNAPPDPRALAALCQAADLIVYMTSQTLHYRAEIGAALARGARVLCCMEPPHVLDRLRFDPAVITEPVAARGGETEGLATKLLEKVGLSSEDADKFPHEFSGGQRQRICIARALSSNPKFIVCDEPTSALDVSVQAQVLNLMADLKESLGLTFLFISHDLTVVRHVANRIGVLYLGRLVEEATPNDLFVRPRHPYTRMLLEAAPRIDGFGREAEPPVGEIPDPINPPPGCAYNLRCPLAEDICREKRPELRAVGNSLSACHFAERMEAL